MVYAFKIIYWLLLIEAGLRCVYFWQLKEYRLDRFRVFLASGEAKRYFFPSRHLLRPKFTLKSALIFFFSLVLARQAVWWLGYLLMPLLVAVAVAMVTPLSDIFKWLVIAAAKIKLVFWHRRLLVIGITGSYGKTATKEILAHVLAAKFRVCKTSGNNNTLIGVAKTILFSLKKNHEVFVVEMGAYRKGEIRAICGLVRPWIGILTGINEQHIGLFGSLKNIIQAKSELIEALPKNGLAIINGINEYTQAIASKTKTVPVKTYSAPQKHLSTNLLGDYQQLNIAAVVTAAEYLRLPKEAIKKRLLRVPQFKTAMIQRRGLNGALIICDTYNSNRDGFMAAIEFCRQLNHARKILITPGISELGRLSQSVHEDISRAAKPVFDEIYVTKLQTQRQFSGSKLMAEGELLAKLRKSLKRQDLVLLEGRMSDKFVSSICGR